jgi:ABC-type dipeptide/oligopeptide/nickel transport system permease subunit
VFGAFLRAAAGFVFGGLVGAVIGEVAGYVRPLVVEGLGESHEITGYLDAFAEWWILVAFLGALLGVVAAAVAESGGL